MPRERERGQKIYTCIMIYDFVRFERGNVRGHVSPRRRRRRRVFIVIIGVIYVFYGSRSQSPQQQQQLFFFFFSPF